MFDESGLIDIRTKEIALRLLDKQRLTAPKGEGETFSEKTKWQLLNTAVPVILVLLFGLLNMWYRKRKYTRN